MKLVVRKKKYKKMRKKLNKKQLVDICMLNQSKRDYKNVTDKDIFVPDIPDKI